MKAAPRVKLTRTDRIDCCKDLKGQSVFRIHILRKGTSCKLKAYVEARKKEISQRGESKPSIYHFAMDTRGLLRHGHSLQKDS